MDFYNVRKFHNILPFLLYNLKVRLASQFGSIPCERLCSRIATGSPRAQVQLPFYPPSLHNRFYRQYQHSSLLRLLVLSVDGLIILFMVSQLLLHTAFLTLSVKNSGCSLTCSFMSFLFLPSKSILTFSSLLRTVT